MILPILPYREPEIVGSCLELDTVLKKEKVKSALIVTGQGSVKNGLIAPVEDALKKRELIKLNSLENCPNTPREVADEIASKAKCDVVQVVGRKMIFYKRNNEEPKIVLPKKKK